MKNTIIFDLDGTLMDTLDDLTASVNYCMEKNGCPAAISNSFQLCFPILHRDSDTKPVKQTVTI